MQVNLAKIILPCLVLAGLGLGTALLLDEHEETPSVRSPSKRTKPTKTDPKPSRERMVALASERMPEPGHEEDELALDDELEALQSLTRIEAAETRREEAELAQANRRTLYVQNLSNLEMAAGEAEVAGDAARAEALRRRMTLLSERARVEGLDEG